MIIGGGIRTGGIRSGGAVGFNTFGGALRHDGLLADFVNGIFYTKPGSNFANAQSMFSWSSSTKWTRNASGVLVASGSNTPGYEWDASGNPLGVRIEGARTNSCLWSDDCTNAAWVKSNVTAAKNATGADGVANSASTLTATAGNGTCLQSFTSTSATRQYGVWVRRKTGSGTINLTVDNGTTWTAIAPTSSWALYSINQAAVTNPVIGLRIVTSGDEIEVQYNQLENGQSFTSSPIPTTTSTVTRNRDFVTRALGSEWDNAKFIVAAEFLVGRTVASTSIAQSVYSVTGVNSWHLCYLGSSLVFNERKSGVNGASGSAASTFDVVRKSAFGWANGVAFAALDGAPVMLSGTPSSSPHVLTDIVLGAWDGSNPDAIDIYLRKIESFPEVPTQARLNALTV